MTYFENTLTVTKTGKGFDDFKKNFGEGDRGYGYIRFPGEEGGVSMRPKFAFVTWCGEKVSVMAKVYII